MFKRFATVAAAVTMAAPLFVVGAASPAAAGDCERQYAPGQYTMRISPSFATVPRGALVSMNARLVRGPVECGNGKRIGFYTRGRNKQVFNLSRAATASERGLASARIAANDDFRWFANWNVSATQVGARSGVGLFQVRR